MKINNNKRQKNLLLVYKNKLIEEFIIVLNKFFVKYLNKKRTYFLKILRSIKLNLNQRIKYILK